jgi:hypothetical protein
MRSPSARSTCVALIAGCCLAGCASTTAPKHWLPQAVDAQTTAYGGWISLEVKGVSPKTVHEGELLAIQADSVFILEGSSSFGLPTAQIGEAKLMGYDANKGPLALWTLAGTLSTFSQGVGFVFSMPVWIIAGTGATASQSRAPQIVLPDATWEAARVYARFPQGLPAGLDRSSLRPKP